jgi:hypothetical protein
MLEVIYCIVIGSSIGLLSGLLGVGGGIIAVPALIFMLQHHPEFQAANIMHMAVCTSLTVAAMTSISTAMAYHRRHALVWPLFWKILPGLVIGLLCGTAVSRVLSNQNLISSFAIFLTVIAIHLWIEALRPHSATTVIPANSEKPILTFGKPGITVGGGFVVGNLSALFGIGGGLLLVPLFLKLRYNMQQATGTSALCGILTASVGALLSIWPLQPVAELPGLLGNLYWPAAALISITSVICAPWGASLAFLIRPSVLKRLFSVVLLISAWCLI